MKLLNGHSLTPLKFIPAVEMSLDLKERDSAAALTPGDAEGISVGSWMQDDKEPGDGIVWRVQSIQQIYDTKTPQVQLQHVISTLRDRIMFGEHKPADITGTAGATTCTARQAINYILSFQNDWTLGTFDYDGVSNPYRFDGDTLFDALEIVSDSLEDAWWSYNFGTYPFTLNITQKSAGIGSEMRAGRNLKTIRKMVDRSGMYTRFYPIGKDDLHIDSEYVEKNTNLYGVISKVETDQSIDSKEELTRWANERLAKHAEPTVTIDVEGLELADATGEDLDSFELGTVCRIPLPEDGTTITERIVAISYRDKIRQPEVVKIQLANSRNDVTKIIAEAIKKSGRGGRGGAKQQKEDHAWFIDTENTVGMVAEGIVGVDAQGKPNWTRLSQIIADENGLDLSVQEVKNGVQNAMAQITITENSILQTVQNNTTQLRSEINQTAGQIQLLVEDTLDQFYTEIIQEASSIVIRTGDNTKTFKSNTAPQGTQQDPLVDGDVWFKGDGEFTWGEKEQKTWLEDAGKSWADAMTSEIYRYNGTANLWEKVSDTKGILQDTRFEESKESIRLMAGRVDLVNNEAQRHYAELKVQADNITSTVNDYYNGLSSSITQTASQIRAEVTDSVNQLQGSITVQSNKIALVVEDTSTGPKIKPAQIVAAINNGASSILISADHINLDGYVKATDITADYLKSKIAQITSLGVNTLVANSLQFATGGGMYGNVANAIINLQVHRDGNNYQIWGARFNGEIVRTENFSRATTLTGAWSSGVFTASASPQGNSLTTSLTVGAASWSSGTATIPIYATIGSSATPVNTGKSATVTNSWSYSSSASTSSSAPSGVAKQYNVSRNYNYIYFNVTCNGQSRRICVHNMD